MTDTDAEIEALKAKLSALRAQKRREYMREYQQRPEVREKRREYVREYLERPEVREKRREYQREYMREYWKRPEVKLRRRLRKAGLSKDVINAEVARLLKNEAAE